MGSRIVSLQVENVKRLTAVHIVPGDDNCVLLGGKNAAGKSSVLDSIQMALGGKSVFPDRPLRDGATAGSVRVDLGNLIVERRFTESGSTLKVLSAEGASFNSPQKILDELYCRLAFDPLKFLDLKPAEQAATLIQLLGIDTSAIDTEYKEVYEERTAVNRLLKESEADVARLPAILNEDQLPEVKPDPADLMNRLNEAMRVRDLYKADDDLLAKLREQDAAAIVRRSEIESDISGHSSRYEAISVEAQKKDIADRHELVRRQQREIAEMQARHADELIKFNANVTDACVAREQSMSDQLAALNAKLLVHDNEIAERLNKITELEVKARKPHEDIDQLREAITTANAQCAAWDGVVSKRRAEATLRQRQKESDSLTRELEALTERKREMLAAANYPIKGLAVSEDGTVLFEGVPFSQSSRAQQIRTSVAIGLAMNPSLRVLLIRDGSLLDDDNLEIVRQMADTADAQIWIERVGNKDESAIIIEDGHIAGVEPVPVEAPKKKTRKKAAAVVEEAVPVEAAGPSELF